ncbi:MAG: hypothetical protein Q8L88_14000 [Bacteroidota bacterium]|nr:hypothetical protein [Bacteroidota bacterium]
MAQRSLNIRVVFLHNAFLFCICAAQVFAQSVWILPEESSSIRIEYLKPSFPKEGEFSGLQNSTVSIVSIYGRAKLFDNFFAKCELPYMQVKITYPPYYEFTKIEESGIANILLGFDYKTSSNSFIECNARIPTMPEKKGTMIIVGLLGDLERWEAYIPKQTMLTLAGNFIRQFESGIVTKVRFAPSALFAGSDREYKGGKKTAFIFDASGGIGYIDKNFDLGFNLTSRSAISPDDLVFNNDQTQVNLGVGAGFKFQSGRLGVYYRKFIEDKDRKIQPNDGVLGINLAYNFID